MRAGIRNKKEGKNDGDTVVENDKMSETVNVNTEGMRWKIKLGREHVRDFLEIQIKSSGGRNPGLPRDGSFRAKSEPTLVESLF